MSSIHSGIAASVSQSAVQQTQAARAIDAARNESDHHAHKLQRQRDKHLESVEDSYETTDDRLTVKEDESNNNGQQRGQEDARRSPGHTPPSDAEAPAPPQTFDHVDLQA